MRVWRTLVMLQVALLVAVSAFGQEEGLVEPRPGDRVEWYVVEPGESLSSITQKFLGVARLWPENLRLNPGIRPNALRVGQRIRVITHRPQIERTAEVVVVSRRVDQKQSQLDWRSASVGDVLRQDDAVRTFRRSSAALAFDDGHQLKIGEESLVLLRQVGQRLTGEKEQSIEIVEGEADLERAARSDRGAELEVVIRGTVAKPTAAPDGRVASRLRRSSEGAAVMVYEGSSSVASGGAQVEVPRGMGTTAREGAAPTPPEPLLVAPRPVAPAAARRVNYSNPLFRWQAVPGAVSYRVEICASVECEEVLQQASLSDLEWRPSEGIARSDVAWRVRGVAATGLDGYASRARRLAVDAAVDELDLQPPAVVFAAEVQGTALSSRSVALGPRGELRVLAFDDRSGVVLLEASVDGGAWRPFEAFVVLPGAPGSYQVSVRAMDAAGRVSTPAPLTVLREGDPPAAP